MDLSPVQNFTDFQSVSDAYRKILYYLTTTENDLGVFFLVIMGNIILLLQIGFAFLESGVVRSKNTINILIKNLLDMFINGISFWLFGYAFAYGDGNPFIGSRYFAGVGLQKTEFAKWFYQYTFAATSSTIISGAVAERCDFKAYIVYSFLITGFFYPVVVHWGWQDEGWLKIGDGQGHGYRDFAGSGIVHMFAGMCSFVGAAILGPRIGRFNQETGKPNDIKGHSIPLTALGGFFLIIGLIAFNAGSQGHITSADDGAVVAMIVANTIIGASFAGVVSLIIHKTGIFGTPRQWSFLFTLNGSLTGMVSICAGGDQISTWAAAILGTISGSLFFAARALTLALKIDDPLDAAAVHFTGGFCGLFFTPFFNEKNGLVFGYKDGMYLAWNVIGIAAISAWAAIISLLMFGGMKMIGIYRVKPETEITGLDSVKHGELAYPVEGWEEEQYIVYTIGDNVKPEVERTNFNGIHPIMAFHNGKDLSRSTQEGMTTNMQYTQNYDVPRVQATSPSETEFSGNFDTQYNRLTK